MKPRLASARTFLFVPGDQPHRFPKAVASGADAIVLDLEDSVQPSQKTAARRHAKLWLGHLLSQADRPLVLLRVNAADGPEFASDVALAIGGDVAVDGILLPKFGTKESHSAAMALSIPIIALIETAAGLIDVTTSKSLPPSVARLAFGAGDFSADLGVAWTPDNPGTLIARAQLAWVSRAQGLAAPIDTAFPWISDAEGFTAECATGKALGYGAKFCIHPSQVQLAKVGIAPSDVEMAWASRVISEWDRFGAAGGLGAFLVDGAMVDEAVVKRARIILELVDHA